MTDTPLLRVVRGNPDDAELAALTVLVAAAASAPGPAPETRRTSWWNDRARGVGASASPGDGAWRASTLPR
ncbi:acyl-CoA carboxylase epsilon subunit [Amycolatopsis benzoatilytica]|uniref:acyl-CoA carboxylase epsilon subunit n=1 Tax=Amycolatopsis benzoatilytica TaxID=346045 RepID=UPI00036D9072|nr:acyl-CoA carboxylase epsilon subunit [Amycolatopsis benzoatilytica]